jgi:WD40 repeat protein
MARVFISHAGDDTALAQRLHTWLDEDGHDAFLDRHRDDGILPGEDWENRLYKELRRADAVVCVVTDAYLKSVWCAAEIGAARALGAELLPVQFGSNGQRHTLLEPLQGLDAGLDPQDARERLRSRLSIIDGGGGRGWPDDRSPYPGLRSFDLGEHRVFFGRSREITQIAERLRSPDRATPAILAIVGPSGCGKSSLVRAGVLPRIAGERFWLTIPPIVPGTDPVGNLARAIAAATRDRQIPFDVRSLRTDLHDGLSGVATDLLIAAKADNQCKLLVVVDQFEELLTQTPPAARAEFADMLRPALGGSVQVLATLRPEFLDPLAKNADLSKLALRIRQVRPLESEALRAVIENPAQIAGFEVDDDLVTRLVADTGSGTALPLLAFTLEQLAEGVTRGGRLSHERYTEIGGVQGALQRQADAALQEACEEEGVTRQSVISALLGLVKIDEQGRPTKRSVSLDDTSTATSELEPFVSRRLLSTYTEGDHTLVAVVHEAFLVNWPPLATEIDEQAAALRARRVVENAANDWVAAGRDDSALLQGGQLAKATVDTGAELTPVSRPRDSSGAHRPLWTVERWTTPRRLVTRVDLDDTGHEFLEASMRTDRSRRRRRRTQVVAVIAVLALIAGVAVAGFLKARDERNNARRSAEQATASRLQQEASELLTQNNTNDVQAFQKLLAANALGGSSADDGLIEAVRERFTTAKIAETDLVVVDVAFSSDERRLVTADAKGAVRQWNADTGQALGPARTAPVGKQLLAVALGDAGPRIAGLTDYNTVLVTNVDTLEPVGPAFGGHTDPVEAAAFSIDGHRLATGSADGTVHIWNADTGDRLGAGTVNHGDRVFALAFSRDGRLLVTGGFDRTARVWNVDTGRQIAAIPHTDDLRSVAISPDGRTLATGGTDKAVHLWNVDTGQPVGPPLVGHANWVQGLSFSSDGQRLASGSADRTLRLWNLDDLPVTIADPGKLRAAALSADARRLATSDSDGTVRLWNAETGEPVALPGDIIRADVATLSADGQRLVAGRADSTVEVWDLDNRRRIASPPTGHVPMRGFAFSADGHRLAGAGVDNTVRVWTLDGGRDPLKVNDTGRVVSMALNSDGSRVAIGSDDGTVKMWNTDNGDPIDMGPPRHKGAVLAVAFSADGQRLASTGKDEKVQMWNGATGQYLGGIETKHTDWVIAVAFSPDRNQLATGGTDGSVRLWDARSRDPIGEPLTGHSGPVSSVAFSSDGKRLLSTGRDKTVRTWPAVVNPEMLCDKLTAEINRNQWRHWITDDQEIGYRGLCNELPDPPP